ncbi:MAG: hypothetical protein J6N32_13575 [Clostridia bacterium]|nr:hypothetical protein [Clostridia bacterium]
MIRFIVQQPCLLRSLIIAEQGKRHGSCCVYVGDFIKGIAETIFFR